MYELAEYWQLQTHRESGREAATAREDRETRPYVVRDLSWELARFLDAEDFRAIAFDTSGSSNGNPPQSR
jgi:hypothetical protein